MFFALTLSMLLLKTKISLFSFLIYTTLTLFSFNASAIACKELLKSEFSPLQYENLNPASRSVTLEPWQRDLLEDYRSTLSYDITGFQRNGIDYLIRRKELMEHHEDVQQEARVLNKDIRRVFDLFNRFPKYDGHVFRSVDVGFGERAIFSYWLSRDAKAKFADYLKSLKPGDTVRNKEYWSSSKSFEVVTDISSEQKIVFIIKSKSGRDLANYAGTEWRRLDENNEEAIPSHEVVFLPGQRFKVLETFPSSHAGVEKFILLNEL